MPSAAPCHRPCAGPQKGPITDLGSRRASHSLRVETESVPCQASACQGRCGLGPGEASRGLPISQAPLRPQGRPRTPPDQGEPPNGLVLPSAHGEAAPAGGALRPSLQTRSPRRTGDPYSGPTGVITGPWDQTLERPGPGCILGPRLQLLQRGLARSLATGQASQCSLSAAVGVSTPAQGPDGFARPRCPWHSAPGCGHRDPEWPCAGPSTFWSPQEASPPLLSLLPPSLHSEQDSPGQEALPAGCLNLVLWPRGAVRSLPCHPGGHTQGTLL